MKNSYLKNQTISLNIIIKFKCYSDQVVSQVLDELGLQLTDQLAGLNPASTSLSASSKTAVPSATGGVLSDTDADLQARLDNLRKE